MIMFFRKTIIVAALLPLALGLPLICPSHTSSGQSKKRSTPDPAPTASTCTNLLTFTPPGELNIAWNGAGQMLVVVAAGDTKDRKLSAKLSDLGLKNLTGNNLKTNAVIDVQPSQSTVASGQRLQVTSTVKKETAVVPGIYVGSLLLELEGDNQPKKCAYELPVRLTVPDAEPLIDKVTLRQYRPLPFPLPFRYLNCFWYDCAIPLRGYFTSLKDLPPREAPLGLVQNDRGHTAVVYRGAQQPAGGEGVIKLPLDVQGWAFAGTYEGKLRSNPSGNKGETVQLTLVVTDLFLWPILAIALSMWLGLRAQRYLNVERQLWRLRGEEAKLGIAFQESQRRFAAAATGTSYAPYSVTEDLVTVRKKLRESLSALRKSIGTNLDPSHEDYKSVLNELESLRKQVAAWGGFADELAELRRALGKDSDLADPPPGYNEKMPALFAAYGPLLIGRKLTLAEFTDIRAQVSQATKGAGLWYELDARLSRGIDRYASLKKSATGMSTEEQQELTVAWDQLLETGLALWEAKDIAALEALSTSMGALDSAETTLRKLAAKYDAESIGPGLALADVLTSRGTLAMLPTVFGLGAGPDNEPADDAARAKYYADATNKWDRRLTLLAFLVATLTALNQYYLGKAFGTFKDYLGLLLLGLGTKLTVDIVSAAVGWISRGQPSEAVRRIVNHN
jgi:hypothetical protein